MDLNLVSVGYGNFVSSGRVIAVVSPESAPVKRLIQEAKEERRLIDATFGKKTKAVLITDSDHIVLTALETAEIQQRFNKPETLYSEELEE